MSVFCRRISLVCAALAAVVTGGPASAQDCTGVAGTYPDTPDHIGELDMVRVGGPGLVGPVHVAFVPGDDERMFVVEQRGTIRIIVDGAVQAGTFLDIQSIVLNNGVGDEQGLLSMAFHPDYLSNGNFFVYYTTNAGNQRVSRFTVIGDPASSADADELSEVAVIDIPHPTFSNHNGGQVAFGADGALYVGVGDGGAGCDPGPGVGNGQNLEVLLGKLLRLEVDTLPYSTTGNPFDGATPGLDEIWSYGLRNPYTFTVDRVTGQFLIGDVGQNAFEEIDCGNAPGSGGGGENYGWVTYEGTSCPNPSCGASGSCVLADYVDPLHEYSLAGAPCAVISGPVYRGCRMPALQGTYIYSDACSPFLRTFRLPEDGVCPTTPIVGFLDRTSDLVPNLGSLSSPSSFAEDNAGEIYVVDLDGEIFRIIPSLSAIELSGPGNTPFVLGGNAWTFEHLDATYEGTVQFYKIYRSVTGPQGTFDCLTRLINSQCADGVCSYASGDPAVPPADTAFFYLVTGAVQNSGESSPGAGSDGVERTVDTESSCT